MIINTNKVSTIVCFNNTVFNDDVFIQYIRGNSSQNTDINTWLFFYVY